MITDKGLFDLFPLITWLDAHNYDVEESIIQNMMRQHKHYELFVVKNGKVYSITFLKNGKVDTSKTKIVTDNNLTYNPNWIKQFLPDCQFAQESVCIASFFDKLTKNVKSQIETNTEELNLDNSINYFGQFYEPKENKLPYYDTIIDLESDGETILMGALVIDWKTLDYQIIQKKIYNIHKEKYQQCVKSGKCMSITELGKFISSHNTLAYNNKYDHGIIFSLLKLTGKRQLRHLLRSLSSFGQVLHNKKYFQLINEMNRTSHYDLAIFFNMSLAEAYTKFIVLDQNWKKYRYSELIEKLKLTDEEYKEWLIDKKKRNNLNLDDPETLKYNKMDLRATACLYVVVYNLYDNPITAPTFAYQKLVHPDVTFTLKFDKEVLRKLYKGGRFDIHRVGIVEHIDKYDVNSMYPYMMSRIVHVKKVEEIKNIDWNPDNLSGSFHNVIGDEKRLYDYVICGKFKQDNDYAVTRVGTYAVSLEEFEGCFFGFELMFTQPVRIDKIYKVEYEDRQEFPDVTRFYQLRKQLKKAKDPREAVYKLILNSSYGKLGELRTSNSKRQNLYYASLITAYGRTYIRMFDALMYLTDSIVVDKPLEQTINPLYAKYFKINTSNLVGDELGQFKKEVEDGTAYILGVGNYVITSKTKTFVKFRSITMTGAHEIENLEEVKKEYESLPDEEKRFHVYYIMNKLIELTKIIQNNPDVSVVLTRRVMITSEIFRRIIKANKLGTFFNQVILLKPFPAKRKPDLTLHKDKESFKAYLKEYVKKHDQIYVLNSIDEELKKWLENAKKEYENLMIAHLSRS